MELKEGLVSPEKWLSDLFAKVKAKKSSDIKIGPKSRMVYPLNKVAIASSTSGRMGSNWITGMCIEVD